MSVPPADASKTEAHIWARGGFDGEPRAPEILFGQVREDARIEAELLALLPPNETAFCIGSGGDTAFALLARSPAQLFVVDVNPAQVFLIELKRAAFAHLAYRPLLQAMTGDARPYYEELRASLTPQARAFWETRLATLQHGMNGCGLADRAMRTAMRWGLPMLQPRRRIQAMFGFRDVERQRRFYRARWNHLLWRAAFMVGLSRPILRRVFGDDFMERVPQDASKILKARIDEVFERFPARDNPYLWQTFRGRYPPGEQGLPPFLQPTAYEAIRTNLNRMEVQCADALQWLQTRPPQSIGFFALSNILEVSSPDFAAKLMDAVAQAAKPGALVCLRAIFPVELPAHPRLIEDQSLSRRTRDHDRSLFCREIRVWRVAD